MEIKVNKEIRNYKEHIFMGLSFRQFFFSILACGISIILYFVLKPYFSMETLSWIIVLASFPFAVLGFVKYNGMNFEELIFVWVKTEIIQPHKLTYFKPKK